MTLVYLGDLDSLTPTRPMHRQLAPRRVLPRATLAHAAAQRAAVPRMAASGATGGVAGEACKASNQPPQLTCANPMSCLYRLAAMT